MPDVPLLIFLTRRSALRRSARSRSPRQNSKGNQKTQSRLTHFLALSLGALPGLRSSLHIFHPRLLVHAPVDLLFLQTCSSSSGAPLCRASCGVCATPHSPPPSLKSKVSRSTLCVPNLEFVCSQSRFCVYESQDPIVKSQLKMINPNIHVIDLSLPFPLFLTPKSHT